jgi:hypothetical protein
VAHGEAARLLEIEVICSEGVEHRRRVEARTADIAGFTLPSWPSVMGRDYVPWTSPRLVVDTAVLAPDEAVAAVEAAIDGILGGVRDPRHKGHRIKLRVDAALKSIRSR